MALKVLSEAEIETIAGTRIALGFGAGLLAAGWLAPRRRRTVGWALLAAGLASTVPLMIAVYWGQRGPRASTDAGARMRMPASS